ncbi:hypothetical protein ACHAXR_012193 [Thalassiosira sp. AJA248-18]
MKSQQHNRVDHLVTWRLKPLWTCLLSLLAYSLCCISLGYVARPVRAVTNGNPSTSTVRPILAKDTKTSSQLSRRLPFLPSRNSRRAAKEAYLLHLQNELESAQRQLYVSQNTCTTLRKRWEGQRKETLELMAVRSRSANVGEEEQQKVKQQEEEIERLQGQLQSETGKYEQQLERLDLLSAELKELQVWKEGQEQSNEGQVLQYEQQLQESYQKQSDYADQVQLLALKLEAAEFAANQNQRVEGNDSTTSTSWEQRAQVLRSELENVRAKYSKLLINSINASSSQVGEGETDQQQKIEEELDDAIQSAVESALQTIENEWEMRYESLEQQLNNVTEYATNLEEERDAALSRVEEAILSSSSRESDQEQLDSNLLKKQQKRLREELTAEMTDSLTDELTEKLTKELKETLAEQMEKKYKKKYKRLRKQLKEQEIMASEQEQSHNDTQQQQIEAEMKKVKEQCELEYGSKLQELQRQSEEQVQVQKERMRKLVKALLEREVKKKGGGKEEEKHGAAMKTKKRSPSKKTKMKSEKGSGGGTSEEKDDGEEVIQVSSLTSSRKQKLSRPGVVPVRGNR